MSGPFHRIGRDARLLPLASDREAFDSYDEPTTTFRHIRRSPMREPCSPPHLELDVETVDGLLATIGSTLFARADELDRVRLLFDQNRNVRQSNSYEQAPGEAFIE